MSDDPVQDPPTFEAFEIIDRTGWGVLATFSDSTTFTISGFASKEVAENWITYSSAAWLDRMKPIT